MKTEIIIGIIASIFIATSLIPQLVKLVKEKNAEHLSVVTLIVMVAGSVLWICYGVLKTDNIIIISNSVSLLISSVTLILAIKFKKV